MTDNPTRDGEADIEPGAVAEDDQRSQIEKLDRLRGMKYELKRYAAMNETSVDEVEKKAASLNIAIDKVKQTGH